MTSDFKTIRVPVEDTMRQANISPQSSYAIVLASQTGFRATKMPPQIHNLHNRTSRRGEHREVAENTSRRKRCKRWNVPSIGQIPAKNPAANRFAMTLFPA
jgi:hypothetical protein